jgi:glycosyltransferase involved in cell wall biosynthesis
MIGRIAVPPESVPRRPNLHFLGKRSYDELPSCGKGFDVAIIPYRLTKQVYHSNPIKLREYLAMGKPVVSVSTPEIDKYADAVAIARTRDEFLKKLQDAVLQADSPSAASRRMARVAKEGWDARLRAVIQLVNENLANDQDSVPASCALPQSY